MTTHTATADLLAPTIDTLEAQASILAVGLAGASHVVESVELSGIKAAYSTPPTGEPMPWRAVAKITLSMRPVEEPEPEVPPVEDIPAE